MSDMQEAQILVNFCLYRDDLITAYTHSWNYACSSWLILQVCDSYSWFLLKFKTKKKNNKILKNAFKLYFVQLLLLLSF